LVGAGGCGKTYLLKKLNEISMVRYTATTACAADLLGGFTVQSYIIKNRKPKREVMIVDEVSMMGSMLFEQLYEWTNSGKAADHAQLILSGDFLQLPPVNDRFFFQASSFFEFAKNAVMIKLTEVKRQENRDQADFLNNMRVGNINWDYVNRLTKNRVHDPQLVLSAKKNFVAEYNAHKLKELGYPIINYERIVYRTDG
jgi:ATP-dependent exoDNAse (exonuclease V) alpha subunit